MIKLYGQESNATTHALCRMNMFLHGMDSFQIEWGDTLGNPRLHENDQLLKFVSVEKYAYRASAQEIADNDFNLNIPRYVDTFEEEIDLAAVKIEIQDLENELKAVRLEMDKHLAELGL